MLEFYINHDCSFFGKVSSGKNMLVQALYTRLISLTQKRPIPFFRWVEISPRSSSLSGSSSKARKRRRMRRKRNGRSFSTWHFMILTVVAIPSLSTEYSVKSLGMERAEWGEFRIGSRSITLQTRSRWVTLLIKKKCKMSLVEFPNHQSCHLWLGTVLYSGHSCSEGRYCGAIHNGQPAGPRLYILHHSQ